MFDILFVYCVLINKHKVMKVNELRVGNIVFVDTYTELEGVPMRIESISYNALCKEYYSMVVRHIKDRFSFAYYPLLHIMKPIPLTEDILLKCGFKSVSDDAMVHKLNRHFRLEYALDEYVLRIKTDRHDSSYVRVVRSLHQLQNLYLAITGKELEVDLDSK